MNDKAKNGQTVTDAPIISEVKKETTIIEDIAAEKLRGERQHFLDEAVLRALPIALTVRDWTKKSDQGSAVQIQSQSDRIILAWEIAQECYTRRLTVK